MQPIEGVTPSGLWTALVVIVGLFGVLTIVGKGVDVIRGWMKPKQQASLSVMEMLANDKRRLDGHEARLGAIEAEQKATKEGVEKLCGGVIALLNHELHNGNSTEMETAAGEITRWLIRK